MADQIPDPELQAIRLLLSGLEPLDTDGRFRVIGYVFSRLGIEWSNVPSVSKRIAASTTPFEPMSPEAAPANSAPPVVPLPLAEMPFIAPPSVSEVAAAATREKPIDIRTYARAKRPTSNSERAALVAYYLAHLAPENERKAEIKAADIDKYFGLVPFETTSPARQILYDAKNAGYLEQGSRGSYKLNTIGFNAVENLPRLKSS